MKDISLARLFMSAALTTVVAVNAAGQTDTVAVKGSNGANKPSITYTENHPTYVLGGIVVDCGKNIDPDLQIATSGLNVGQSYQVPGPDMSDAIRRLWNTGLFSNVSIEADSIAEGKIYLRIKLTEQPRISSISYNGVKKGDRDELEKRIGLVVGGQMTPNIANRVKILAKRYFDEKGFKNAEVDIRQKEDITAENRVIVDIDINKHEKIKVRHIYITGVDPNAVSIKKLKRAMKKTRDKSLLNIFKSKKFLPEKYEEDKGLLIDKMNAWGYRDALIKGDSVATVDESHVDVHIDMFQGQKYYIRNIEWVGNTVYNTEALQRALKMKTGDVYDQELLEKRLTGDEDAIGNQYYNNGYVFYHLDPVEVNVVNDSVDLEMRISEGRQATLNHVRISGNERVYENVIRRELRTKPGDLFSRDAIMRSLRELASMNQFDPEKITPDIKPDPYNGTVDINYNLVTKGGDQVEFSAGWGQTGIVGRLGLKFTNFSMQNLFSGGYKRAGFIPQGDGQTFSVNWQSNGQYYNSFSMSFLDPWFGRKRPNQFSISAYYSKQSDIAESFYDNNYYNNMYNYLYGIGSSSNYYNYTNYYDPDKYVKMIGVSVGFGKRLRWPDDYFTFMAELAYTRYMLKSWRYFLITDGNCNNINLTLTLSRNSTDQPFFPRRGSEFTFSVSATPPYSLWDNKDYKNLATNYQSSSYQAEAQTKYRWIEYNKWKMKFRSFTSLANINKTPVLMTRAEFGILGSYNRYNKSPFESFYMGGDGMSGYTSGYATETIGLRGYENGSIAGNYGDNAYAYTRMTLELRYPLMLETSTSMYGLAFVEGGNAWTNVKDFNPFNLKRSAGVGVRIYLPMIGLMGIDWAYGFQKYNSRGEKIGGSQFHFIIGQEF